MECNGGFIPLGSFNTKFKFHSGVRQIGAPRSETGATVTMGWNEAMLAEAQGWGTVEIGRRPHDQRPHLMEGGRAPDGELYPDDGLSPEARAQQRVAAVRACSSSAVPCGASSTFRATASEVVSPMSSAPLKDDLMNKPLASMSRACPLNGTQRLNTKPEDSVIAALERSWLAQKSRLQRLCAARVGRYSAREVIEIADKVSFVGEVNSQRKPHGEGILLLADGSQHVGRFLAGRADGQGFYFTSKGQVVHGSWKENLRVGAFLNINEKGEVFHELYSSDGKRSSRRRASAPSGTCDTLEKNQDAQPKLMLHAPASTCSSCNLPFHQLFDHAYACRRHGGEFTLAEANGNSADSDRWSCCGSASRSDLGCGFSSHSYSATLESLS